MDFNNDGKKDLLAGDSAGNVWLFSNNGTNSSPTLAAGVKLKADGKIINPTETIYKRDENNKRVVDKVIEGSHELAMPYTKIHLADWDADGLPDLLVGGGRSIIVYKNAGTKTAPKFLAPKALENAGGRFRSYPSPYVVDWDGDGIKDLLSGCGVNPIVFYRNEGSNEKPKLAKAVTLEFKGDDYHRGIRCRFDLTDWNNDGKLDMLVGNACQYRDPTDGNIWLFLGK